MAFFQGEIGRFSSFFSGSSGDAGDLLLQYRQSISFRSVVYHVALYAFAWVLLKRCLRWLVSGSSITTSGSVAGAGGSEPPKKKREKRIDVPVLLYRKTARNKRLLEKTGLVLRQPYVPSPWLNHHLGGHMQSFMFATWCPPSDRRAVGRLRNREERVVSSFDGGSFRLDWFDLSGAGLPDDAPVVFVLPGVVGQGTNVYVRHLTAHLSTKYGWRVVAKSWRGIGSRLTTRRPETWDHVALSDARDGIRHVREAIGPDVPLMGVGFSFGGCLLTALAGSVPQEEHGLCGVVSVSGLFDMGSMMKHIAEQYPYPYGCANTRVTVRNYRKFKVLETLTAAEAAAAAMRCKCMIEQCAGDCKTDAEDRRPATVQGLTSECVPSAVAETRRAPPAGSGLLRSLSDPALATSVEADAAATIPTAVPAAGASGSAAALPAEALMILGVSQVAENVVETMPLLAVNIDENEAESISCIGGEAGIDAEGAVDQAKMAGCRRQHSGRSMMGNRMRQHSASMVNLSCPNSPTRSNYSGDSSRRSDGLHIGSESGAVGLGARLASSASSSRLGGGSGVVGVKAKDLNKMTDPLEFHEALTLPFTGDASVEAYYARIESVMGRDVSSVKVPTLALLARDDPLCPPLAWKGALERAAESDGIIVAITDQGGHCGWFEGMGAGSWLDKATGEFLASAMEVGREETLASASDRGISGAMGTPTVSTKA